jgi:hypothetical protein
MDAIIPLDKLGNFPILQLAGAIVILAFGAAMMWRAFTKGSPTQQERERVPEQRWYFEGPIAEVFKQLALIGQQQARAIERSESLIKIGERTNELLDEILRAIRDMPSMNRRR